MSEENGKQNGKGRRDDRVRVALVGVGNCANSLLQGREYYKDAPDDRFVPGLMHVNLGGYHVRDVEFTAAFDVVKGKVGVDLADEVFAGEVKVEVRFSADCVDSDFIAPHPSTAHCSEVGCAQSQTEARNPGGVSISHARQVWSR